MNHICVQDIGTKVSIGLSFFLISNYKYNLNMYHMCAVCLVAQLCPALCDRMDCSPPGSYVHGDSPGKNTGVACHALLQGIFPTQGSKPGLSHCTTPVPLSVPVCVPVCSVSGKRMSCPDSRNAQCIEISGHGV